MSKRIRFSVSDDIPPDAKRLLEMFVESWLEKDCVDKVKLLKWVDPVTLKTVYEVCPESTEDECWLRLKGIPRDLGDYITLH